MKSITYEGTNFNAEHLSKKTLAEFISEFEKTPVYNDYSAEDRHRLFKEAYAECRKAMGLPATEPVITEAATESAPVDAATEKPSNKGSKKSEDK